METLRDFGPCELHARMVDALRTGSLVDMMLELQNEWRAGKVLILQVDTMAPIDKVERLKIDAKFIRFETPLAQPSAGVH
jgi:hypothetical protein